MNLVKGVGNDHSTYVIEEAMPPNAIRLKPEWVKLGRTFILSHAIEVGKTMAYKHNEADQTAGISFIFRHGSMSWPLAHSAYFCALATLVNEQLVNL